MKLKMAEMNLGSTKILKKLYKILENNVNLITLNVSKSELSEK